MTYRLVIDPKAIAQAAEIHRYYRGIGQVLADRFERELDACYAYIEQNPAGYQVRTRDYRHAQVKGFRYRVVYAVREGACGSLPSAPHQPQAQQGVRSLKVK